MLPRYKLQTYLKTREDQARMRWEEKQRGNSLQQTFTPFSLTYEMLERLPSLEGKDVLVVANMETFYLLKYLKVDGYVNFNSVTLLTDIKKLEGKEGVSYISFEELDKVDLGMKFDVIIGNPPYQIKLSEKEGYGVGAAIGEKKREGRITIWDTFFKLAINTSTDVVAFITPDKWVYGGGRYTKSVIKSIEKNNAVLELVDSTADNYFKVGESICWFIVRKNSSQTNTQIKTKEGSIFDLNVCDFPAPQNAVGVKINNIISKVFNTSHPKVDPCRITDSNQDKYAAQSYVSTEQSAEFSTPVVCSHSKTLYTSKDVSKWYGPKLILNNSGTYYSEKNPNTIIKADREVSAMNAHMMFVNDGEVDNAYSVMTSKLFRFVVESDKKRKGSGFNGPSYRRLPRVDFSHAWSDIELYDHFNLTQEEIDLIESSVK